MTTYYGELQLPGASRLGEAIAATIQDPIINREIQSVKPWDVLLGAVDRGSSREMVDTFPLFIAPWIESIAMAGAFHAAPDCANRTFRLDAWNDSFFTHVQRLHLIKCSIEISALRKILSFPKHLNEFQYICAGINRKPSNLDDPDLCSKYLDILLQQKHSLKEVALIPWHPLERNQDTCEFHLPRMKAFTSL